MIKKLSKMIKINYNVDEKSWKKNFPQFKKYISKTVEETISAVDTKISQNISITFFLTSNKKMRELNLKFRKKNKTTDVLSFPMKIEEKTRLYVGDIAISYEIIKERSKKTNFFLEFDKMWIHGYLHLIGYDHKKLNDFKKMFKKEKIILKYFHKVN